jgi:hypothetical protein
MASKMDPVKKNYLATREKGRTSHVQCDGSRHCRNRVEMAYFVGQSGCMGKEITRTEKRVGKARGGRPERQVTDEMKKTATRAAYLGMPHDRVAILCGFSSANPTGWGQYLVRHPEFAQELESARVTGEVEMQGRVLDASNGWQGAAWLLERTRGYVARASLEHTGKGGKELSISGSLLGAFGGGK